LIDLLEFIVHFDLISAQYMMHKCD